ncbi:MAG: glycoside hydrolase family 88 protein [Planctomycetaceae bacterium]|jgi:rhamnogalacturonyl hydrolase YesR|nr:glycoside hydrolase family 88 protein [Planctomycetaceae bacterium]
MRKTYQLQTLSRYFLAIFLFSVLSGFQLYAQSIFDKESVKSIMDKVNRYQVEHPHAQYDDNWIRGTYYTGVMSCYLATGDEKYLEQCDAIGKTLHWKIPIEKLNSAASGANTLTLGQTWIESYLVNPDKKKIESLIKQLENPQAKNPISRPKDWYYESGQHYADSLFTGPPTLAMLYSITKDEKYLQWMDAFFWDVHQTLFDNETNLFYRDKRFLKNLMKTQSGKKILWSRGNGWTFAGIARILKYTPKNYKSYKRYEKLFCDMAIALKNCQAEEGFWYPNLDDKDQFPVKETSGTAFFVYGLAYGINSGILERNVYLPVVEKAWKCLCESISKEGKVQWGQTVGDRPVSIKQEDSHEYVSGIFLLAASEIYKLQSREKNK